MKLKKLLTLSVASIALIMSSSVSATAETTQKLDIKVVKSSINNDAILISKVNELPMFQRAKLTATKVKETNGIYYVSFKTSDNKVANLYLTKDMELMIHSGTGISTKTGVEFRLPINVSQLDQFSSFTYGSGKEVLYVFTDPECPFCKNFEKTWPQLTKKYTMKVFMLPLSFHKEAPEMTHWLLSAKTDSEKGERLVAIANGSTEYKGFMKTETVADYKIVEESLSKIKKLAAENGVTGTPTTITADGKRVAWPDL